jgi:hypothetical protein
MRQSNIAWHQVVRLVPHFGVVSMNEIAMEHGLAYLTQRRAVNAAEGILATECGVLQRGELAVYDTRMLVRHRQRVGWPAYL